MLQIDATKNYLKEYKNREIKKISFVEGLPIKCGKIKIKVIGKVSHSKGEYLWKPTKTKLLKCEKTLETQLRLVLVSQLIGWN